MWRWLPLTLLVVPTLGTAQTPDYFPLEVGNTWTYFQELDPPGLPPDTLWRGPYEVTAEVVVNDTLYYRAPHPFAFSDTLRADADGRIWARVRGKEVLLFDFTREEGAVYSMTASWGTGLVYEVRVERIGAVEVGAGRFEDVVRITFDIPMSVDEERIYAFAPGVGIVYAYGSLGDYEELYSAVVGGQAITPLAAETPPGRPQEAAWAYPNPSAGTTTLVFPARGPLRATAGVYDVLGRRVATLPAGDCAADRCVFRWDGTHLPRGLYVVRFVQGRNVQAVPVVLGR